MHELSENTPKCFMINALNINDIRVACLASWAPKIETPLTRNPTSSANITVNVAADLTSCEMHQSVTTALLTPDHTQREGTCIERAVGECFKNAATHKQQ